MTIGMANRLGDSPAKRFWGGLLFLISLLSFLFATPTAAILWTNDRPSPMEWWVRSVSTVLSAGSLVVLFWAYLRSDVVPNFLARLGGSIWERDGFCFRVQAVAEHGLCYLVIYWQSEFDHSCRARIAIRPGRNFFLTRSPIAEIVLQVECPPAGFGVARVPLPLEPKLQGARQSFEVGASVEWPEGRGYQVRFRSGGHVPGDVEFRSPFQTGLSVAAALTGHIHLPSPAQFTLQLPHDVCQELPPSAVRECRILWKLGDADDFDPLAGSSDL
jgi:hypothetical protein